MSFRAKEEVLAGKRFDEIEEPAFQLSWKKTAGGMHPGSRFLSNASSKKKREAPAFPPAPSERTSLALLRCRCG